MLSSHAPAVRPDRARRQGDDAVGEGIPAAADVEIWVPVRGGRLRVPIETIDWIEAARDYVLIHAGARSHMLRITMSALDTMLAGTTLIRVHRSAFVRPARVAAVRRRQRMTVLLLSGGIEVQVGPSYLDAVARALGLPG